jgi:hypothetical protein
MEQIRFDTPRCANEAREQRWNEQGQPRPAAQVADDAMPVGEPVGMELLRPHHVHFDAPCAHVLDRVGDEATGHVMWVPRVRRREDADLHDFSTRKTT